MQLMHKGLILVGKQLIKGTYERINPEVFRVKRKAKIHIYIMKMALIPSLVPAK